MKMATEGVIKLKSVRIALNLIENLQKFYIVLGSNTDVLNAYKLDCLTNYLVCVAR